MGGVEMNPLRETHPTLWEGTPTGLREDMEFNEAKYIQQYTIDAAKHHLVLHERIVAALNEGYVEGQRVAMEKVRLIVAKLYCASGCSCCRDNEEWNKATNELGEILKIPKFNDDSGYDFWAVIKSSANNSYTNEKV